jgi:hypothetical protein
MRHIYTHDNILVLHSVKNILAINGIESFVKNEHSIPVGARHGISNIFHELWILSDQDYQKALSIIDTEIENPPQKEPWLCAQCNEENDGSFEICWQCQSEQTP